MLCLKKISTKQNHVTVDLTRLLRTRGSRGGSPWLRWVANWDLGDFL